MSDQHPFELTGSPFDTQPEEKLNGPEKKARGRPKKVKPVDTVTEVSVEPAAKRTRRGGRPRKAAEEKVDLKHLTNLVETLRSIPESQINICLTMAMKLI